MFRRMGAILLFLCLVLASGTAETAEKGPYTAQEIFSDFVERVVKIDTSNGGGTGFFVEENVIATNNHVIKDAKWLKVTTCDGSEYDVTKVLAKSENPDLALLQAACSGTPVKVNTHGISEGEPLYTIGGPMGIYPCISDGIVMKSNYFDNNVNYILSNFHSIGGNSGGPVFNAYGELMGVVVGGMIDGPNSIDMVIRAEYIPLMDRSLPYTIMTQEEYLAEMNKPEEEKYEHADLSNAQVGQLVKLGRYEQDNDLSNGAEDIYWLVQEKNGNELMLVSLYCLDVVPFHNEHTDITWEHSDVRRFLNEDFFHTAFHADEQRMIVTTEVVNKPNPVHGTDSGNNTQDKVYMLSLEEVMRYNDIYDCVETFYGQLYACASKYAISKGAWLEIEDSTRCWWWLRDSGGNPAQACEVGSAGYLSFNGGRVNHTERAVRPVIRVTVK